MAQYIMGRYKKANKRIAELEEMLALKVEQLVKDHEEEIVKVIKKRLCSRCPRIS